MDVVSAHLLAQSEPPLTEFELSVGECKLLQFKKRPQITAVAELVWNALDANATEVDVELRRSGWKAITDVVVTDNGHGPRRTTSLPSYLPAVLPRTSPRLHPRAAYDPGRRLE